MQFIKFVIKELYSPLKEQKIKNKFYKCRKNNPRLPRGRDKGIKLLNVIKNLKYQAKLYK
jgi:hypothetical protein